MQVFALCESLNAVGVVLDVHKLLENRKTSAEAKVAALDALGEISKAAGAFGFVAGVTFLLCPHFLSATSCLPLEGPGPAG